MMTLRALLAALLLGSASGWAHDAPTAASFNLVTLAAQAEREVPNDVLHATLAAEAEGAEPARLADEVNATMRRALEAARAVRGVRTQSGNYQTHPMYEKGRIVGWRVRQELRLESADFAAATALIGRLQASLAVTRLALGVSAEARRQAENALLAEAIAAFEERARLARDALKAKDYRIRELQIGGGGSIAPRPLAARALAAEIAPPAVEAGTTRIVVTASGTVQLE